MKKLSYILAISAFAVSGLTSCNPDKDPKVDTSTDYEFVLNTPQFATQFIDLATNGKVQFTVSQPNYGLTLAPTYGIQISLKPDFTSVTEEPVVGGDGEEHVVPGMVDIVLESQIKGVLVANMSDLAAGINELNGIFEESQYEEDYVGPLYVRATAHLGSGTAAEATATVSNVVMLSQVQGYASFSSEAILLYIPGNAGGWSDIEPQIALSEKKTTDDTMVLYGFAKVDGEFKINDGNWDGAVNWGAQNGDDSVGLSPVLNDEGETVAYSVDLYQNGGNLNGGDYTVPAGLYFFWLEITDYNNSSDTGTEKVGTLKITEITSVTLPGDYNGWDASGNPMTADAGNSYIWTGAANVTSGGWKFAMNNSWDINLGGTVDELIFDEGNLYLEGTNVTLDLTAYPWHCTVQ
ncbi:MAG: hypothetical protein J1F43_01760 [Muribaculaceae bacterium]|nr:hypothetical protein [Muribaculaceae bacterium]